MFRNSKENQRGILKQTPWFQVFSFDLFYLLEKKAACDEKASFSMSNLISNVQLTMPGMCGRRRVKN